MANTYYILKKTSEDSWLTPTLKTSKNSGRQRLHCLLRIGHYLPYYRHRPCLPFHPLHRLPLLRSLVFGFRGPAQVRYLYLGPSSVGCGPGRPFAGVLFVFGYLRFWDGLSTPRPTLGLAAGGWREELVCVAMVAIVVMVVWGLGLRAVARAGGSCCSPDQALGLGRGSCALRRRGILRGPIGRRGGGDGRGAGERRALHALSIKDSCAKYHQDRVALTRLGDHNINIPLSIDVAVHKHPS